MTTRFCRHVWVANSGQGGDPVFKKATNMSLELLMHVMCKNKECDARTWFTEKRWNALLLRK